MLMIKFIMNMSKVVNKLIYFMFIVSISSCAVSRNKFYLNSSYVTISLDKNGEYIGNAEGYRFAGKWQKIGKSYILNSEYIVNKFIKSKIICIDTQFNSSNLRVTNLEEQQLPLSVIYCYDKDTALLEVKKNVYLEFVSNSFDLDDVAFIKVAIPNNEHFWETGLLKLNSDCKSLKVICDFPVNPYKYLFKNVKLKREGEFLVGKLR